MSPLFTSPDLRVAAFALSTISAIRNTFCCSSIVLARILRVSKRRLRSNASYSTAICCLPNPKQSGVMGCVAFRRVHIMTRRQITFTEIDRRRWRCGNGASSDGHPSTVMSHLIGSSVKATDGTSAVLICDLQHAHILRMTISSSIRTLVDSLLYLALNFVVYTTTIAIAASHLTKACSVAQAQALRTRSINGTTGHDSLHTAQTQQTKDWGTHNLLPMVTWRECAWRLGLAWWVQVQTLSISDFSHARSEPVPFFALPVSL